MVSASFVEVTAVIAATSLLVTLLPLLLPLPLPLLLPRLVLLREVAPPLSFRPPPLDVEALRVVFVHVPT